MKRLNYLIMLEGDFKNKEELRKKIEYYLAHPKEREEIAKRGQERVLKEYTYKKQMEEMIKILQGSGK